MMFPFIERNMAKNIRIGDVIEELTEYKMVWILINAVPTYISR